MSPSPRVDGCGLGRQEVGAAVFAVRGHVAVRLLVVTLPLSGGWKPGL